QEIRGRRAARDPRPAHSERSAAGAQREIRVRRAARDPRPAHSERSAIMFASWPKPFVNGVGCPSRSGGDIKYVRSRDGRSFGDPSFIYAQSAEGGIPKVIANKPLWHNGSAALPFWREHPGVADCKVAPYAMELSGTLLSQDDGKQWFVGGDAWSPKLKGTRLLEGALVELPGEASEGPRLMQLFRSTGGKIWRAVSADGGRTWAKPRETSLPNPNSKVHATRAALRDMTSAGGAEGHDGRTRAEDMTRAQAALLGYGSEVVLWDMTGAGGDGDMTGAGGCWGLWRVRVVLWDMTGRGWLRT
ncbi:hypothetical protein CYMTET_30991, partial [Cymbomonas tetramitiformis]